MHDAIKNRILSIPGAITNLCRQRSNQKRYNHLSNTAIMQSPDKSDAGFKSCASDSGANEGNLSRARRRRLRRLQERLRQRRSRRTQEPRRRRTRSGPQEAREALQRRRLQAQLRLRLRQDVPQLRRALHPREGQAPRHVPRRHQHAAQEKARQTEGTLR